MDGMRYAISVHIPGTLSANQQGSFALPGPMTLVHVSAVASNNSDATIDIGDAGDTDGIVDGSTIGDSGVPTELDPADFNGALCDQKSGYAFPSTDKVLHWSLDYDGAAGTAAQNVTLVFTFVEGGN